MPDNPRQRAQVPAHQWESNLSTLRTVELQAPCRRNHMCRRTALLAATVLILPLASLAAQESDEEWLLQCRESSRGDWYARARHCEVRETGLKATGKPLTVDPSMNGGVEIEAWETDSIAVTARIQTKARTMDEAVAIARDIHLEASGAAIRAIGPASLGYA